MKSRTLGCSDCDCELERLAASPPPGDQDRCTRSQTPCLGHQLRVPSEVMTSVKTHRCRRSPPLSEWSSRRRRRMFVWRKCGGPPLMTPRCKCSSPPCSRDSLLPNPSLRNPSESTGRSMTSCLWTTDSSCAVPGSSSHRNYDGRYLKLYTPATSERRKPRRELGRSCFGLGSTETSRTSPARVRSARGSYLPNKRRRCCGENPLPDPSSSCTWTSPTMLVASTSSL